MSQFPTSQFPMMYPYATQQTNPSTPFIKQEPGAATQAPTIQPSAPTFNPTSLPTTGWKDALIVFIKFLITMKKNYLYKINELFIQH